jgi:hypothetical protein
MNSMMSAERPVVLTPCGAMPERPAAALDRRGALAHARSERDARESSVDIGRSPNLSLPAHSGFYAQPVPLNLILSLARGESQKELSYSYSPNFESEQH